jgi:hypothetical protein
MVWNDTNFGAGAIPPRNLDLMMSAFLGAPVVADPDRYVVSVNLTNAALTVAAQPDCPRNVTVTVTDTTPGITAGTVTVVGTDAAGRAVTEAFDFSDFESATAEVGTKIFATITSITAAGFTALGGSGDETIIVGCGTVIGLPTDVVATGAVKHVFLGGARITSPVLAAGVAESGVDASASTYNGTKLLYAMYNAGE